VGNIAGEDNSTPCPRCGAVLVRRRGYRVDTRLLALPSKAHDDDAAQDTAGGWPPRSLPGPPGPRPCRCVSCGAEVPVYW
jgi:predicted RNA-binding Zn-ribbon protein involved in translation (DUF1610 family)